METVTVSVRMTKELKRQGKILAATQDTTLSELLVKLLIDKLAKEQAK